MKPIGTPLALATGMQSLPFPAPVSSSAPPTPREDAPASTRRHEGFAERLQERAPKERPRESRPERPEQSHSSTGTSTKTNATRDDAKPSETASEAAPIPPLAKPSDDPAADLVDMPAIAPGSMVADALLALVGTTSAAIDPTQPLATDLDPLLAALATLLSDLPHAQALPATGAPTLAATGELTGAAPTIDEPAIVPSLLTLVDTPDAAMPDEPLDAHMVDPRALLSGGVAMTATTTVAKAPATTTTSADAPLTAQVEPTSGVAIPTGMQATTDDASDQAAHQPAAPVMPTTTATTVPEDDAPFTIAEPRAVGEAPTAKPAAAPVARPAPEAGNPMERAVANQVSRALIRESADGSRMISLRLTPPELGTVRIDIVERAGVMTARLHAEDAGVRVALERYLPQLRQDLLSHNAPVRELQLADAWAGDLTRQNHSDQQGGTGHRRGGRTPFSLDGVATVPVAVTAAAMTTSTITADSVDARA